MNIRIVFKFKDCKLHLWKTKVRVLFRCESLHACQSLAPLVVAQLKCHCFFVVFFFFSSAAKWKNCAIVPSGHWAPNTTTTNCDPMKCSHADHACYIDDDWRCHARTGPGHMTSHGIFAYITLLSVALYFNVFGLRSPGASRCKRSKYLQTHAQVVLFAANPH